MSNIRNSMRRWLPFGVMMSIIILSGIYLFANKQKSVYVPQTDSPQRIYHEACAHCHGEDGRGAGILYPEFNAALSRDQIKKIIAGGGLFMPAFVHITGDTLDRLILYIHNKQYIQSFSPSED
jgi:hypothetical protein